MKTAIATILMSIVMSATLQPVQTQYGAVSGIERDGCTLYLGIPYAKPPVGELAFLHPQEPEPWEGVLKADHASPNPIQHDGGFSSLNEEGKLLSMNVWTDEEAVTRWRNTMQHRMSQKEGREKLFESYKITVCKAIREYSDTDRDSPRSSWKSRMKPSRETICCTESESSGMAAISASRMR